uniref:Uncharacterized protein n=1 Tax=Romanomermis culicivorax TaxID=13658 RepID=A0A915HU52_ROMCU
MGSEAAAGHSSGTVKSVSVVAPAGWKFLWKIVAVRFSVVWIGDLSRSSFLDKISAQALSFPLTYPTL